MQAIVVFIRHFIPDLTFELGKALICPGKGRPSRNRGRGNVDGVAAAKLAPQRIGCEPNSLTGVVYWANVI
ncbi:MAG: hypothetical protein LBU32_19435 [Clostridiales bacterium]|jgi:hypothetical protein|nr:hypothetical protein [Clostridiales bacterium]